MGVRSSRTSLSLLATATVILAAVPTSVQSSRLACGVCEALVDEVNLRILSTTATHSVQTRFRVDEKKRVPYARTEHNLLDILEGEQLVKDLSSKYGIVKPHGRTARLMKAAYARQERNRQLGNEGMPDDFGATPEELAAAAAATAEAEKLPEAPETPVSATTTEGTSTPSASDAAVAAEATGTTTGSETPVATPASAPAAPVFEPFIPRGSVPLALTGNHVHLAVSSAHTRTGMVVESSSAVTSEIRDTVEEFLEQHLDATMLMFHREVQDIKQKLCIQETKVCKPQKHNSGKKNKKAPAKPPKVDEPVTVKDEL